MQKTWKTSSSVLSCFRMFLSRKEVITELYRLSQDTWSRPWTSKVDSIFLALRALIKPRPQNSFTIFAHLECEQKYLPTLNVNKNICSPWIWTKICPPWMWTKILLTLNVYQLVANSCLLLILKIPCSRSSHSAGARALQKISWRYIEYQQINSTCKNCNKFLLQKTFSRNFARQLQEKHIPCTVGSSPHFGLPWCCLLMMGVSKSY